MHNMFAFHPDVPSHSGSNFDERRWVIHLRQSLDEEIEEDGEVPISIFSVPKTLVAADPDSYVPQEVAIGPYHCRRPELYEMERYKLAAAKRFQKSLQTFKFSHLVEQVAKYEIKIRAHYHKLLNCNGETLGWMMAVDASFLLEVLQAYAAAPDGGRKAELIKTTRVSSIMSHFADISGVRKSTTLENAILRDMVKLENQIPLLVLRKILEIHLSSSESADDVLTSMLIGFCKEVSPFKLQVDFPNVTTEIGAATHLLDVLYRLIITMPIKCKDVIEAKAAGGEDETMSQINGGGSNTLMSSSTSDGARKMIEKMIKCRLGRFIKGILFIMPWKVMSLFVPGLKLVLQPIESSYLWRFPPSGEDKEAEALEREKKGSRNADNNNPPLAEEIAIPSVSELHKAGVTFLPMKEEGIADIYFDEKKVVLYLPCICVDLNTAVFLRNLVAYEAGMASGPVVLTRYTELMNGIIDTDDDVRILRERGVILNRLKSDEEVAKLWNGMSRSVRLTKVPFLDKAIDDVNKYYHESWKVKMGNVMKRYVFGSWRFLTLFAAIALLILMSLQAFCSIFGCFRLIHVR